MSALLIADYEPARLTPDEEREAEAALESREEAAAEIARALYWLAATAAKLRTRRERILFGCNYLRRRIRRLPIEQPPIKFYSIESEGE